MKARTGPGHAPCCSTLDQAMFNNIGRTWYTSKNAVVHTVKVRRKLLKICVSKTKVEPSKV